MQHSQTTKRVLSMKHFAILGKRFPNLTSFLNNPSTFTYQAFIKSNELNTLMTVNSEFLDDLIDEIRIQPVSNIIAKFCDDVLAEHANAYDDGYSTVETIATFYVGFSNSL